MPAPVHRLLFACVSAVCAAGASAQAIPTHVGQCLTAAEAELAAQVNAYRQQNGRNALPVTRILSSTAQWHVWDLGANSPAVGNCNLHSWSAAVPAGVSWQPMCYTPDHSQAAQMWAKPAQISGGVYQGNGFEIAANALGITPSLALSLWQNSPVHRDVILNQGSWTTVGFGGMGVGLLGDFAVVWFGSAPDPQGTMPTCTAPSPQIHVDGFE